MRTNTVTRLEVADAVRPAFATGAADTAQVIEAAASGESRAEIMETLHRLPNRRYRMINELWEDLGHLPVD